jgi:hypothetical protein
MIDFAEETLSISQAVSLALQTEVESSRRFQASPRFLELEKREVVIEILPTSLKH